MSGDLWLPMMRVTQQVWLPGTQLLVPHGSAQAALGGTPLFAQAALIDPSANPLGLVTTGTWRSDVPLLLSSPARVQSVTYSGSAAPTAIAGSVRRFGGGVITGFYPR